MSITIHIGSDLEKKLQKLSALQGVKVEHYIEQILKQQVEEHPTEEEKLLEKINTGLPDQHWSRYFALKQKRIDQTLTKKEHQELIDLYDEIEKVNAQRMNYLVKLSQLRNTPIRDLMKELGIKKPNSNT